jgi:signal peptidase
MAGKEGASVATTTIDVETPVAPDAPPAPDDATGRWLRRITPALSILCWFYLSVVAFLFAWVVVVWAVVGWKPMVVTTGSMQPAINPGDIVLSAPPEPDVQLSTGTVITFEDPARPGELITHRVESVNPDGTYSTRGDANSASDSYEVAPDELTGVGRLLVPAVGLPRVWLDEGRLVVLGGWVIASILAVWGAVHRPRQGNR